MPRLLTFHTLLSWMDVAVFSFFVEHTCKALSYVGQKPGDQRCPHLHCRVVQFNRLGGWLIWENMQLKLQKWLSWLVKCWTKNCPSVFSELYRTRYIPRPWLLLIIASVVLRVTSTIHIRAYENWSMAVSPPNRQISTARASIGYSINEKRLLIRIHLKLCSNYILN